MTIKSLWTKLLIAGAMTAGVGLTSVPEAEANVSLTVCPDKNVCINVGGSNNNRRYRKRTYYRNSNYGYNNGRRYRNNRRRGNYRPYYYNHNGRRYYRNEYGNTILIRL